MRKKTYKSKSKSAASRKSRSNASYGKNLVDLARMMGAVERGRKNPDSRISEAYEKGASKPTKVKKKSLF